MTASITLNRTKIKEIGRDGIVGWRSNIPSQNVTLRQLEYGSMDFWNILCNKETSNTLLDLNDFKTGQVDILGYKTDDNGTFLGTVQYPKLRPSGFGLNIGDPAALAERSFTLVGEDEHFWQNSNKYVIFFKKTCPASGTWTIEIGASGEANYPDPVLDPDLSGNNYFIRVVRVRGTTTTEMEYTTNYTYNPGTTTISLLNTQFGDVYKFWYSASSYITGVDPFVQNDSDGLAVPAEATSIYFTSGTYVYRLQSVAIDVSFERQDIKEIGNSEIVSTGIKNKTVRVTLGRILESFTIEEILRGKAGASWGKINPREFLDNIKLIVKCYEDETKSTFKIGYSMTNLSATTLDAGVPLDDYATRGVTMEGEEMVITSVEGSL